MPLFPPDLLPVVLGPFTGLGAVDLVILTLLLIIITIRPGRLVGLFARPIWWAVRLGWFSWFSWFFTGFLFGHDCFLKLKVLANPAK